MKLLFGFRHILMVFSLVCINVLSAQDKGLSDIELIDFYLANKNIKKADSILKLQTFKLKSTHKIDSLHKYPYYIGKISLLKTNKINALNKVKAFTDFIKANTTNKRTYYKSLINLADFYDELGETKKSLEVTEQALVYAQQTLDITPQETGRIYYNIGATHLNLGNLEQAKLDFIKSLRDYESFKGISPKSLSDVNNALGATMWMSSKLDSAKYYYSNAIKSLIEAKSDTIKNLYYSAIIKSNIALLEQSQGQLSKSIDIQKTVISNYQEVIDIVLDENIRSKAKRYQARTISNLAATYNTTGFLKKANEMTRYALSKNKAILDPKHADIAGLEIQLGQSELALKNYDEAIKILIRGIQLFDEADGNPYWKAAAFHALAEAYNAKGNIKKAIDSYDQAESLFKQALGDNYDKEFLLFLNNKSLFLADNNEHIKALKIAKLGYNYVLNNNKDSFLILQHIQNLADIYFRLDDYDLTAHWTKKGKQFIAEKIKKSTSKIDSIKLEFNKPRLLLLESKAKYKSLKDKNEKHLIQIIDKLDKAITLIEKRKASVFNREDINFVLEEFKNVADFSKKLNFELYALTNDKKYLNKTLELHESSIYNRIQSRLNLKDNLSFLGIPQKVIDREKKLKASMTISLDTSKNINSFFKADMQWNGFLDSLKLSYPKYFKMRYESIKVSLDNVQNNIPENTTVVRYMFIEDSLNIMVITKTNKLSYSTHSSDIKTSINSLNQASLDFNSTSKVLHNLYLKIWKPIENSINTHHVIIIPDENLFSLSFESLTPQKINTYKDYSTNSLLAKHSISYNYSLMLLGTKNSYMNYDNDFIAFAPEFNDTMKTNYKIAIADSIDLDKTYLKLLPQPFTLELAQQYSKLFNGNSFLNEKASKQIFTQQAKEHKIIHIGTHAESNNVSPELSRLIFAKSINNDSISDDNSLYTYEIYNQNLASNLAILTACETGKPAYQSGEGMISLAHAFNYAGSKSILTSLWKIDEQSSMEILTYFYDHLSNGLNKDEALRQAKLNYLSTAQGRTLSPQYWAGLVLIGDNSPVDISTSNYWWVWMLLMIIIFIAIVLFRKNTKHSKA